jgi:catechol 2,3-dioxygenase-like lactoylglutathione lyase family enzyme
MATPLEKNASTGDRSGAELAHLPPTLSNLVTRDRQEFGTTAHLSPHVSGTSDPNRPGVRRSLYPIGSGQASTTGARIGFSVDSVDELVPLVRAAGAEIVSAPHDSAWGRRAVVRDLDGHTVELVTPPGRTA